jgi:uncharacterized protein (TIGR00661 family)
MDPVGKSVIKAYAPSSADYGFHFKAYADNIFTPVIRKEIRDTPVGNRGHYTVYLPAYSDKKIIKILGKCNDVKWEVFSKHFDNTESIRNIDIFPIDNNEFIKSMASSEGVLCGAGFETPAEALYLKKKLLVIPMKNQFEQHCNASALKELGVPVMKSLKAKHLHILDKWLKSDQKPVLEFPDSTEEIINYIIQKHYAAAPESNDKYMPVSEIKKDISVNQMKSVMLKKLLLKLAH